MALGSEAHRPPAGGSGGPSVGRGDRGSLADPLVNDSGGSGAPNGGSRGDSWSPRSPLGRAWRWKGRQVQRQPERQALGIRRPRTERVPAGDTRAAPRARSDGGQHAEGRGAERSGRSETSQSLPGFCIGAGVQPGDALTAGAAGGLAGRAGRHHVATLPPGRPPAAPDADADGEQVLRRAEGGAQLRKGCCTCLS